MPCVLLKEANEWHGSILNFRIGIKILTDLKILVELPIERSDDPGMQWDLYAGRR
jgi:hypothetical protein